MRHRGEHLIDVASTVAENAAHEFWARWILGVAAAGMLAAYGGYCLITQHALLPRTKPLGLAEWSGGIAVAVGSLYLSAAALMHCHWFWSGHPRWHGQGQIGKLVSLVAIVASLGWMLFQFFAQT